VLETYNSSALPYSRMIVGKTNNVRGDLRHGKLDGGMLDDRDVHIKLNSTRLYPAYLTLHENSVHMMVKVCTKMVSLNSIVKWALMCICLCLSRTTGEMLVMFPIQR
jgi:hypothetical protein